MKPKTYILIALPALCLWLYSFTGYSQLYNCGTNIKIGAGTTLAVNGKFSNKTAEGIDATINNAGKIYVTGDWINNTAGNVFINIGSNGTVYLNGDSIQNIAGSSPTFFENITFTGTGEKILGILGIAIKGLMALDAVLKLNHHRLIIDNSSPGALTYTARIISEDLPAAGYGELQWNTGAATGSYNIPFGNSSGDIFPLCFTITEGSPGNGQIIFATYPADSAGMPLPEGTAAPTDPDKTADRYWIIDLQNYAALPKADIQFTYLQSEISSASNTIDEARLKAAYYDQSSGFWLLASGVADTTTNKVTTNELYNELQNKVWTLKQAAADTGTTCQTARLLPPATYACTGTELQITGTEYWMKFTADTSKLMIVISNTSRVPMANITKLQLFSGNCDNLTLISQKEKVNNEFLNLSIDSLVVDSSYLIKVSQPQSVTGFFNIFLRPLIPERPKYFKGALYFKVKEAFTANLCYDVDSSYSYNHIALDSLPFIVNFNITGILKPFNSQASSLQRTYKLLCNDATNLDTLISRFLSLAFIDYCVKLPVYYPSDDNLLPLTDTRLSDQWYFNQIYATGAWNAPVGSNTVRVAIIDDAFLISHEDFLGVVSQGYYDYANDDTDPTPPIGAGGMAYNFSHGTHCAGLLAAASDNGKGIASLNRGNIQIIPYKVKLDLIDPDNPSEFMMGLEDIVGNICDMVPPPQVISMSFGSLAYNPLWGDIISSHTDDILFVAAAGNDNLGACHYPAAFAESKPNIISVGATTYNDERAFFSNFGSVEDQISVVAPGYNILSTSSASNNSYEYKSGTSMSTPIVAGLSALLLTHNSNLTPAAIKQCLIDNGDALPLGTNFDESVKRINALKSLSCILNSNDPPVAFFNYQPACLSVQFTDHSIAPSGNDITSWSWSFQNASIPSSTDQNPTVVFNSYGTSQVSLTVTNSSGSHTYTQDITIEQPVSIVAHSSKTVCKNKPSYIYVQLQGEAPYTLTYQLNLLTPVTFTTYENPCPINITHQITDDQTIFHLTSFSNLACTSAVDLSFTFNLFDCTICSKEDYNWVFGNHAGITFQNGPVQNLTSPTSINQTNCTASISDNFGNLSFYTDGNTIWRASDGFEITSSLNADLSISQPVLAFQNPVYSNEYLIFTINAGNYYLSVLNIQTWDLSSSNQLLNSILPGTIRYQQSAFPIVNSFGNTIGFWVVVHSDNLEKYYTIRVENSNWSSWSVTTSNSNYNDASGSIGSIKFSHDGTKIVSSIGGDADEPAHIEICDFNLTNSDITNCKTFKLPYDYYFCSFYGYGLEFSPDNSKLYISDPNKVTLYQLDLISEDINIIAVAESNICLTTKAGGALLLAPDGRIYCPNQDNKKYLSVINDPDKPFPYCGFVLNGHSLAEDETDINVWSGLPNIAINCIPLGAAVTAFENITCAGQSLCNGSATVTASGGMPPYLYLWSDLSGQTTAAATNLCPGQYYVTVTDDNNDQAVANVTIIEPAMFSVSATVQHPCGGGSGAIHTIVNGGTPPYTYEWNTSETTDEIYPSPGTYYVTVTDANNCTATNGWTVETLYGPEDMNIDFSPQSCLYLDNSVSFTVSALQQPITTTYNWNFGDGHTAQGSAVSNTYDGNYGYYCVTLDAANQCGHSSFNKTFFVYPDDCACTTYNYPDQSNLGSGISGVTLTVEGDLFVTQNCTIQSSTLQFGPKGRLIVKKGKILTINQSLLTTLPTCNNYLWQGIEVWGYYNAPSDELNQGKIIIDNQTVIENAHIAVLLGARNIDYICDDSQPVFYNTASGGIINARTNSTFNSNGINIKFTPKHPSSLIAFTSEIKNCYFVGADLSAKDPLYVWSDIFTCYPNTTNPFTQASSGGITYMGIYVEELKNVGGLNGFYNNTFSNMQYGIESANARFNIKNCSFTDLGTGIFIHNYTSAINVYHSITDQCFFDRVQYAVFINGGKNDMIQNNSFGTTTSLQSQNFCGIFSHSSSGFSILDNDFNSFNYGIRIMKSGSNGGFIKNSIRDKGNIFFSCKKSIETVSDNSALKIKCNTHTNNPTAYFRNWTNVGTLAPQGESPDNDVTKPAGNTFTPFGYQQLSSNSNYIYYCHNNPWTVKPVSVSNVSVNDQNSLTFISTTACPINNTSQPISVLETRFNQLNTANSILRLRFDSVVNILDRGQTAVLLSMIQGNTSEGNLKNKLLANSPLSDNVVSELISTNKLAPGNFKNVMSKNLPVTKTVEPAFLNKITQLPPGIADQLIKLHANNPGVVTLASIQRELDRNNITQKEIMARLTRIYIDSSQTDKAIQLLETQNDAGSKQTLISSLIAENRLAEASTLLGSFTPADDDEADWVIVNNILLSLETQGNTIYDLNSDQTLQLRDIATTCPAGLAAVNAQSILRIVFNDKFIPCPDDTLSSARYRNTPETNTNTSFPVVDEENIFLGDNYPNPFNHKTVIPYYLPEGFIAVMQINDVHGRLLSEYSLKTGKNLMEIDTEEWAAGVYYYSLISNGETLQNKKMVLVK